MLEIFIDARKDIIPRPYCVQINHGRFLEEGRNCISLPNKEREIGITPSKQFASMPEFPAKSIKDVSSSADSGISSGTSRSSDVAMDSAIHTLHRFQSSFHRPAGGTIPRTARDGSQGGGAREMAKGEILGPDVAEADGVEGPSGGTRQPPKKKKPKRNPKKKK